LEDAADPSPRSYCPQQRWRWNSASTRGIERVLAENSSDAKAGLFEAKIINVLALDDFGGFNGQSS
jgi:hypothetical protein